MSFSTTEEETYEETCSYEGTKRTEEVTDNKYKIPMIIAQTWKTDEVPRKWQPGVDSIQNAMPDWEYMFYNDKQCRNLVLEHFPQLLPLYDSFKHGVQRADLFRYVHLYVYGGVYLDLDYMAKKSFSDLLDLLPHAEIYVIRSSNFKYSLTNSFIISRAHCDIWVELLDEIKKHQLPFWAITNHLRVMCEAGPYIFSKVLNRHVVSGRVHIIDPSLIYCCSVCNPNCKCGLFTQSIAGESSWSAQPWDSRIINWMNCNYIWILIIVIIIIAIAISIAIYWTYR